MLVTILTMIFNQSSIAWRIGVAGVSDMDDVRDNIAELREEADNAFVYGDQVYRHVGLWDSKGNLRYRACAGDGITSAGESDEKWKPKMLFQKKSNLTGTTRYPWNYSQNMFNVGQAKPPRSVNNYTVNVMSGGPANNVEDWQAIWSFPDDPNEW